jgi:hypothetical protein
VRDPRNRLKNWTGTVHYSDERGAVACGPVATHASYLRHTVEDVNCKRCIAKCGADEITGQTDPAPVAEHVARRATERAARRAAREKELMSA